MGEKQVPRVRTPITMPGFVAGLRAAYVSELGREPDRHAAAVHWGHLMIETSGVQVWNYNPGNIKYVEGCGSNYFDLPAWEMVGGKRVDLKPGDKGRLFRAYDSLFEGLSKKLRFLYEGAGGRYAKAWALACRGAGAEFAIELKRAGYYTGDEKTYARAVANEALRFVAQAPEWAPYVKRETTVLELLQLARLQSVNDAAAFASMPKDARWDEPARRDEAVWAAEV